MRKKATVDKNVCVACGACINECPREAIAIVRGCYASVDASLCVGCGKCSVICPASSIVLKQEANDEK